MRGLPAAGTAAADHDHREGDEDYRADIGSPAPFGHITNRKASAALASSEPAARWQMQENRRSRWSRHEPCPPES
jgi:hypothetical protein